MTLAASIHDRHLGAAGRGLALWVLALLAAFPAGAATNTPSNDFGTLTMTPNGRGMKFQFDPTARVDCGKIVVSQTVKLVFANGGDVAVKPGDLLANWRYRQDDTLDDGTFVDHVATTEDPYNNGDDRDPRRVSEGGPGVKEDRGKAGKRNASGTEPAEWNDYPRAGAGIFPTGKNTAKWEFEICILCAEGAQAGTVYGCATWTYTQPKNGAGSSASTTDAGLEPPSSTWRNAVDLYEENHINDNGERFCPD